MSKITIAESDIRQALEGIDCPRIRKSTLWNEYSAGRLDDIIAVLIEKEIVDSVTAGIRHLLTGRRVKKTLSPKVRLSDLQNISSNKHLYKVLDKLREKEKTKSAGDPSRVFGVIGHATIPYLFSGDILKLEGKKFRLVEKVEQMNFGFNEPSEITLAALFPQKNMTVNAHHLAEMSIDRKIKKIEKAWKAVVESMKTNRFPVRTKDYSLLVELMKPIFKEKLDQILKLGKKTPENSYLAFITVMSWTTALLRYLKEGSRVLFTEIALLPHRFDVGLGRIDALEVETIDGQPPTIAHLKILRFLSKQDIKSVGHLIRDLVRNFGSNISLVIHDWKFCAGDGDNGVNKTLNLIRTENILEKPQRKDQHQMERYTSSTLISYAMVTDETVASLSDVWKKNYFSISGKIHYFQPNIDPIVHEIILTDEQKKEIFKEQVVQNYSNGERRKQMIDISSEWLKYTISLLNGEALSEQAKFSQLELDLGKNHNGKISTIIKDSIERKWVDEYHVIENVGINPKTGKVIPRMHYDQLIDQMKAGNISSGGKKINYARPFHIPCFLPGHIDKTPSFSVNLPKNVMGCFSCGIMGRFDHDHVPEYLEGVIVPMSNGLWNKSFSAITEFSIPQRHREIMVYAQKYLQLNFLTSAGVVYLEKERGLNPELSWKIGAGFDDGGLIPYLLDMEFTYDELILYGFINIQPWVKEDSAFVRFLKVRGYKLEELIREVDQENDNKKIIKVPALPIPILVNRVTYPLDVQGIITNFYGRSINSDCDKRYTHQKTACNDGVPQGSFNVTNAMNLAIELGRRKNKRSQLLITESPIDVDTFIQRSDIKAVGAIVGTGNDILQQILATFRGDITYAYDNDSSKIDKNGVERGFAGQKATARSVDYLESVNFEYRVFNFTAPFARKHPEYKDINKYWTTILKEYKEHGTEIEAISILLNRDRLLPRPPSVEK